MLLTSCVTLDKSLNFSVSLFLHFQDEGDNILLRRDAGSIKCVNVCKELPQCLAYYVSICLTWNRGPVSAFNLDPQVLSLFLNSASLPFLMQLSVFDPLHPVTVDLQSPTEQWIILGASSSMLPDVPYLHISLLPNPIVPPT